MSSRMVEIRSFAVATFLLGRGARFAGARLSFGTPVYMFDESDAADGMREYARVKGQLDAAADAARIGGAA